MFDQCTREAMIWWCVILLAIHPWAATGAAFGCCFFLSIRSGVSSTGWQKLKLGLFTFGLGYAAGVFFYPNVAGEPWNEKAMLVSAAVAALGSVAFTAFYYVIDNSGPLPAWLKDILDRIPMFQRRSDNDGS